ncbi:MAG: PAS domain S-box protein [Candidatus Thermoplasmatota archaeon]|nr:PAS domain S-box protein [Candidatus Thermoplasmatota archaeon]
MSDSDNVSGPSNGQERVILEIAGGLQALKKILRSEVGLFEKEILYRAGLGGAGEYCEKKQAGLKPGSPASTLNEILRIYTSEGLGDYRVEKIDEGTRTVEVTAKNGFETMTFSESTELQPVPSCSYTSGFLAGICKHAFDDEETGPAEIFAIEVECVAQGKERCRFIVAPIRELERAGHKVECKEEPISEHTLRLNEEILLRNLDLQNLALTLERKVRKRTEELRRSEENYRSLINLSPDPILIIAMDGRILSGNRSCLDLLGYGDRDDLEGRHINDILSKDSDAFLALKWALDKEGSAHNFEMDLDTKLNGVTTVEASARVAEIDKESCIQATLRDVTERSRLERQLVEAKEESEFLNDLLSHDIINHTTAAMHFLDKLERSQGLSESERKDMKTVSKAIRGAHELSSVVRDAKRVGALGSNDCESKDLVTVLRDAIDESKRTYPDRKVTVNFTPPTEPCNVMGSPLLTRLFANLLTNAIKFDHNEEVVVDVDIVAANEEDDDYWSVRIADYGRGILDDEKPKVFERYYRQDHSVPGAGLGLHLVSHLVECCGGTIRVENRVEGDHRKGTVMITSLMKVSNDLNRNGHTL